MHTLINTAPALLADLGVMVSDRTIETYIHVVDEEARDPAYCIGNDKDGNPHLYQIHTDKFLMGEFKFPIDHPEIEFTTDFCLIPYIQEMSVLLE